MDALTTSLVTAFLLGLFSSAHCIAMCGSVIGALTLTLPAHIREQPRKMLPFVLNYNIGRILSYSIAGGLVGLLASPLAQINGLPFLRYLSVLVMIGMGLYLAGWFPKFAHAEKIGAPIWRKLQPIGQKLLPVRSLKQAFLLGAVWGWLPCGLVYAGLAVAATTGDVLYAGIWIGYLTGGYGGRHVCWHAGLISSQSIVSQTGRCHDYSDGAIGFTLAAGRTSSRNDGYKPGH
jgi:uncharacterized protein